MNDKFPKELRTFETRLLFLKEVFNSLYTQKDVLAHCVAHKLNRSLLIYDEELQKSIDKISEANDPLYTIRKLN